MKCHIHYFKIKSYIVIFTVRSYVFIEPMPTTDLARDRNSFLFVSFVGSGMFVFVLSKNVCSNVESRSLLMKTVKRIINWLFGPFLFSFGFEKGIFLDEGEMINCNLNDYCQTSNMTNVVCYRSSRLN